jgi:glycosyltransferase involved in cell wall biosynthesis
MSPLRSRKRRGRVLYVGHAYYNSWYLSRELRKLGWTADVLNWDTNPATQFHYHGEDYRLRGSSRRDTARSLLFYLLSLPQYDIFHFSNMHGLRFANDLHAAVGRRFHPGDEIRLLKRLGKKIVYTNNGCMDGVSQTSFASWGDRPICEDCAWRTHPEVCSDEGNLSWGSFRNEVADLQILLGGNRTDYNVDPRVREVPEFYCLDDQVWRPDLEIPPELRLDLPASTVKIYHAVGMLSSRSQGPDKRNVKSTHIYLPLIEQLKREGHDVEVLSFHDVPNRKLRYYQRQADIVVDMLTYGWYGANVREALMLGKPVVCYLRPEWLESARRENPEFIDELPIVSATPETVHDVLVDLISSPEKRLALGRRGRDFAVKWHSARAGARRMDSIYSGLLEGSLN